MSGPSTGVPEPLIPEPPFPMIENAPSKSLVSVVIPVYNMEEYLPATLDSVLASDYPLLEVIVIDDGSTDNSLGVAERYAARDERLRVFHQENAGVCAARNRAVAEAQGRYVLPVDADNLIVPTFVRDAAAVLDAFPEVKVVAPRADFFGDRRGEWALPPFSLHLLARKNIMDTCAMYRRADWERVGGYCEEIVAREDWEFWIAVLKDGGEVRRLPYVALHYRIRQGSKRTSDRLMKRHVVDTLNRRHPEFFERELDGPLRYHRSWSRLLNRLYRLGHPRHIVVDRAFDGAAWRGFVATLPRRFAREGTVVHQGRNELRRTTVAGVDVVIKAFRIPNFVNRVAYGLLRPSKARRSYEYAFRLRRLGIGTPRPVAYYTERNGLLFGRSYYLCQTSECPYTYADLSKRHFPEEEAILRAIARTTARMHENGLLHKDYSRGNILFRPEADGVRIEVIDLNRIRFGTVGLEAGCKNFERLPATPAMLATMADEYAAARGFDAATCLQLMTKYNTARHETD